MVTLVVPTLSTAGTHILGDAIGYRTMLLTAGGGFLLVAAALAASRFRDARVEDAVTAQA